MKRFNVKEWENRDYTVHSHGDMYCETYRGADFVVYCPECGDPDVEVTTECDVKDGEIDETSFFWADYKCKSCGCEFRQRFNKVRSAESYKGYSKTCKVIRYFLYILSINLTAILGLRGVETSLILITDAIIFVCVVIFGVLDIIFVKKYLNLKYWKY